MPDRPLRIVLTNSGTTGDLLPLVALAKGLRRAGHDPVLAASAGFEPLARRAGLAFASIGPELREAIRAINIAMIDSPDISTSTTGMRRLGEPLARALPEIFAALRALCRDADVLVAGSMQPAARMVHEISGIPFASIQLSYVGSRGTAAYRAATADLVNGFRATLGLRALADPLTEDAESPQLALHAISRHVFPGDRSWPAHRHVTGYLFDDDDPWTPEPALAALLDEGAPVVITFGSNMVDGAQAITARLVEAVQHAGCRAILQHGWTGLGHDASLPSSIFAVDYVPHHWLFSRASCVVHHGGAGTTGAAFRAGVPTVVVPHVFDQFLWAHLAEDLGCAGAALPFRTLDARQLGAAIASAVAEPSYRLAAQGLGDKVRAEQGVSRAIALILALAARAAADGIGHHGESHGLEPSYF